MRSNQTKAALRAGERVLYIQPHFASPDLVEFLGLLGFDGVFLDAEHGGLELAHAQNLIRAADCTGTPSMVRVPRNEGATIQRYLDIGAGGVLVPHVRTAEEAKAAVESAKFGRCGTRGAHAATRAAGYGLTGSSTSYFEQANRETLVAAMIEDVLALENLERIVATPHLDLCLLGREDLAMSFGHPGQPDHRDVLKATDLMLQVARRTQMPVGITTPDCAIVPELFARGFQFVVVNASRLLANAAREVLARAGRTPATVPAGVDALPRVVDAD